MEGEALMAQERKHANAAQRQAAYRKRCEAARQQQLSTHGLPSLPVIATLPGQARWTAALSSAQALVTQVSVEMRDYYDARTETWQESKRGEQFQERLDAIEDLLSQFEQATL
jgi:hypothetical protein